MRALTAIGAVMVLAGSVAQGHAADITMSTVDHHAVINIVGSIEAGDEAKFLPLKDYANHTGVVRLSSTGGDLKAALEMGSMIRNGGWSTYVPVDTVCGSACAFMWLAGEHRAVASTGRVGFHAAYRVVNDIPSESGQGNALVGAYLSRLGLQDAAIAYMTAAAPNEVSWLSKFEGERYGIDYEVRDDGAVTPVAVAVPVDDLSAPAGSVGPNAALAAANKVVRSQKLAQYIPTPMGMPNRVGECITTKIKTIGTRLLNGHGTGSAVEFENGGFQTSYEQIRAIDQSRPGDVVVSCLKSLPENCPIGDFRGKVYRTTNERTGRSWTAQDFEHVCGGH